METVKQLTKEQIKSVASFSDVVAYELRKYLSTLTLKNYSFYVCSVDQLSYEAWEKEQPSPNFFTLAKPFVFSLDRQVFDHLFLHIDRNKLEPQYGKITEIDLKIYKHLFSDVVKEHLENVLQKKLIDNANVYDWFSGISFGHERSSLGVAATFVVEPDIDPDDMPIERDLNGGYFRIFLNIDDYIELIEPITKDRF